MSRNVSLTSKVRDIVACKRLHECPDVARGRQWLLHVCKDKETMGLPTRPSYQVICLDEIYDLIMLCEIQSLSMQCASVKGSGFYDYPLFGSTHQKLYDEDKGYRREFDRLTFPPCVRTHLRARIYPPYASKP